MLCMVVFGLGALRGLAPVWVGGGKREAVEDREGRSSPQKKQPKLTTINIPNQTNKIYITYIRYS